MLRLAQENIVKASGKAHDIRCVLVLQHFGHWLVLMADVGEDSFVASWRGKSSSFQWFRVDPTNGQVSVQKEVSMCAPVLRSHTIAINHAFWGSLALQTDMPQFDQMQEFLTMCLTETPQAQISTDVLKQ
jgi:hypothetical protein